MGKRKEIPEQTIEIFKANYLNLTRRELGKLVGFSLRQVKSLARKLGLKKCEWSGGGWNKGMKTKESTKQLLMRTTFKQGHIPKNHRPVGSERYCKRDGWQVKIAEPNQWEYKSRYLWKLANGEIPDGYKVRFKDKDNNNLALDNLELVATGNLLMLNNNKPLQDETLLKTRRLLNKLGKILKHHGQGNEQD